MLEGHHAIQEREHLKQALDKTLAELNETRLTAALKGCMAMLDAQLKQKDAFRVRVTELEAERDALATFKSYVHRRLDEAGIPTDPESPHEEHGCRIGGRLDITLAALAQAQVLRDAASRAYDYIDPAIHGWARQLLRDALTDAHALAIWQAERAVIDAARCVHSNTDEYGEWVGSDVATVLTELDTANTRVAELEAQLGQWVSESIVSRSALANLRAENARLREFECTASEVAMKNGAERDAALARESALRGAARRLVDSFESQGMHPNRLVHANYYQAIEIREALALTDAQALAVWRAERAVIEKGRAMTTYAWGDMEFDYPAEIQGSHGKAIADAVEHLDTLKQAQEQTS